LEVIVSVQELDQTHAGMGWRCSWSWWTFLLP